MSTTPWLGITELTPNQTGKETTINNAILALEAAGNASLAVNVSAGNVTLSVAQFTGNFVFKATGATADRILNLPAQVNGVNTQRIFAVINGSATYKLTVQVTGAPGTTVVIPKNGVRLLCVDGSGNVVIVAQTPQYYRFGGFAPAAILGDEILSDHIVTDPCEFPANFAGSLASVGVNPAATWTASIQKNAVEVGTISITTSGAVTFTSTGGTAVAVVAGDVITLVAPSAADANIGRLRWSFKGVIS